MKLVPSQADVEAGSNALVPFIEEWNLPLNPEDLDELSWAVIRNYRNRQGPDAIRADVEQQIRELNERIGRVETDSALNSQTES